MHNPILPISIHQLDEFKQHASMLNKKLLELGMPMSLKGRKQYDALAYGCGYSSHSELCCMAKGFPHQGQLKLFVPDKAHEIVRRVYAHFNRRELPGVSTDILTSALILSALDLYKGEIWTAGDMRSYGPSVLERVFGSLHEAIPQESHTQKANSAMKYVAQLSEKLEFLSETRKLTAELNKHIEPVSRMNKAMESVARLSRQIESVPGLGKAMESVARLNRQIESMSGLGKAMEFASRLNRQIESMPRFGMAMESAARLNKQIESVSKVGEAANSVRNQLLMEKIGRTDSTKE